MIINETLERALNASKERSFSQRVKELKGRTILLYGAGGFGVEMLHHLRRAEVFPTAFLDRNASEIQNREEMPVYHPEDAPVSRCDCVVLFCIVMDLAQRRAVLNWLRELGYSNIMEGQAFRALLVAADDRGEKESLKDYYLNRRSRIESAGDLFQDKLSCELYQRIVYAQASGNYEGLEELESPMKQQYFPPDIHLDYQRFTDCGGYIGDTTEQLIKRVGAINACVVFEPDPRNYTQMCRRLSQYQDRIGQRWLFPCAVSGTAQRYHFASGSGSGTLSADGEETVQTLALDMAIPDFHPTMIKMDIEGSEMDALRGARNIIVQDRPDLAICTYHTVNHIWDIPLQLHEWGLGYRFYLRCYNAFGMETVLYATAKSEE